MQSMQVGTILVGFLGLGLTLQSHRRQIHAQMFVEFSARFHHMLGTLPAQIWTAGVNTAEPVPPRSDELTKACLQCFHIIADLFYLHRAGYISKDLWRPWQRGIQRTMRGPVLRREWLAVEGAFSHAPELCTYMRGLITEGG
jgi:hypothetical protein